MHTNNKVYSTMNDVVKHEILPLVADYEEDFDLEFLALNLIKYCFDDNWHLTGFRLAQVSDKEFNTILEQATEIAGGYRDY